MRVWSQSKSMHGQGVQHLWRVKPPIKFVYSSQMDKTFFNRIFFYSKSCHIYMEDAECAETNEKLIFRFCYLKFFRYGYFCTQNWSIFDEFWVTFFFFKIGQIYMKDAKCTDTNEKSIFRFLFFELSWKIHRKLGYKNVHNSKNKNRENLKFEFSFVSEHSSFFM